MRTHTLLSPFCYCHGVSLCFSHHAHVHSHTRTYTCTHTYTHMHTRSLTKAVSERPKYDTLVEHPFIKKIEQMDVDVAGWYRDILDKEEALA